MLEKIDSRKFERLVSIARAYHDVDVSALEATVALMVVAKNLEDAMEQNLGRFNLSRGRFMVLLELIVPGVEGLTPADLADKVEVSRGTMTGLLDTLARDGLVVREPSSGDRRTIMVKITDEGSEFIKRILPENFFRTGKLMAHLSLADKANLVDLLAKVKDGIASYKAP